MANKLEIKITSKSSSSPKPKLKGVRGGTISITGASPHWVLTSTDDITHFKFDDYNKEHIIGIEIVKEALTSLQNTFENMNFLTTFKVHGNSCFNKVTSFEACWYQNSKLKSFPEIDTSNATTLKNAWHSCYALHSFPLLNTSKVTDFYGAWLQCSGFRTFPKLDTSKAISVAHAWDQCHGLTSFPDLDLSNAETLEGAWYDCSALVHMGMINSKKATDFKYLFVNCRDLQCIRGIDTTSATITTNMFDKVLALVHPNAAEQAQIQATPGINWVSGVPVGEDCRTWVKPIPAEGARVGLLHVNRCYLGAKEVDTAFLGKLAVCDKVPYVPPPADFEIEVTGPVKPKFKAGMGALTIKEVHPGVWNVQGSNVGEVLWDSKFLGDVRYPEVEKPTDGGWQVSKIRAIRTSTLNTLKSLFRPYDGDAHRDTTKLVSAVMERTCITDNVTDMSYICGYMSNLTGVLDFSFLKLHNVTDFQEAFTDTKLTEIKFPPVPVNDIGAKVTSVVGCFENCTELVKIDGLKHWDTENITAFDDMFHGCRKLTDFDGSSFNTKSARNMSRMFGGCNSLPVLDLSTWDTSKVKTFAAMFQDCHSVEHKDLVAHFDTSSATDMMSMFDGMNIKELDLSSFDTRNVSDMRTMFGGMKHITVIDLTSFHTPKLEDVNDMFSGCTALTTIKNKNMTFESAEDSFTRMFEDCHNLVCIDSIDSTYVDSSAFPMNGVFDGCGRLAHPSKAEQAKIINSPGLKYLNPTPCS